MHAIRFDSLTRSLTTTGSRRGALGALRVGTLGLLGLVDADAKKGRAVLGADVFAMAWAAGKGMTPEDAIEEALTLAVAPVERSGGIPGS